VLYARLSDMAEMLDNRGNPEAANFHQLAARAAGVLGTQLAQGGPVSTEWGSRQRFYRFRGSDNPADAAGLLGIRYSVMRLTRGAWEEVDPTTEYHAGGRLRLRVEPNTDGYFYVATRIAAADGKWCTRAPINPTRPGRGRRSSFRRELRLCSMKRPEPSACTCCFPKLRGRSGWLPLRPSRSPSRLWSTS